mgnify:FL=1
MFNKLKKHGPLDTWDANFKTHTQILAALPIKFLLINLSMYLLSRLPASHFKDHLPQFIYNIQKLLQTIVRLAEFNDF